MSKKIYIFLIFYIFSTSNIYCETTEETYKQLSIFNEVFNRVKDGYVEEVTDKELIEKALNGMLSSLDPHSGFMNEESYKEMQIDTEGSFGGLGIQITMDKGYVKVISPIDDTPAKEAGIESGDYITHLNGESVLGLTVKEAIDIMRGEVGEPIEVTIVRDTVEEPFNLILKRDIIKVKSVRYEIVEDVAVLRIATFNEQTTSGLKKVISEIQDKDQKIKGYIIDLRGNPGGLLTEAISVTDLFLNKGEIVSVRGRGTSDVKVYSASKGDVIDNKPLVVLIDQGSASASEIVAGALQDHKRAPILGITSFGKGSVQQVIPIDSGAIRLTVAKYYTPSGDSIQAVGIKPDIIVPRAEIKVLNNGFKFSESQYKDALINETNNNEDIKDFSNTSDLNQEDYQLSRAIDAVNTILSIKK